ncbi:PREDICTED: retinoid-inducible serine carboxypeptidase-like [Amphimedon queenslandica]|uniref:Carboxypeptidase n=1 Tax=Amphimedon queenslandica TaxID=400682 RepID=A0A1X7VG56_AMPQE|nr:PREDICTED: retinoid-inducible serine carboxypeptidase-like [Amphimedon queenslandica]|eukprot:XP_003384527.1 PREDICTED: retinoid-inducible serine carboxypeptidase-like [Amphimedon queenslandica]
MSFFSVSFLALALALCSYNPVLSSVIPDEDWAYVDVRPGAHMFWWLYGCSTESSRDTKPLVMWLQGGPGGSSTGFGNFMEIGPLDVDLQQRPTNWVQSVNILFVDNPVGTGYSYVDEDKLLTTNVTEIAQDLLTLFASFLKSHEIFQSLPFYIFSESYGGKMTAAFGVLLNSAIQSGKIQVNFKGVALGDSWISPIDSVLTWGPYLYATSLINENELAQIQEKAMKCKDALLAGQGKNSTILWGETQDLVEELSDNVNVYNILEHNSNTDEKMRDQRGLHSISKRQISKLHADQLGELMNGQIKKKLNIPEKVTWGGQSGKVFTYQSEDFMKDVIADVDTLLSSNIDVVVYSGQLDLIVDTPGTLAWIQKLKWPNLQQYLKAKRVPLYPPSGKATKATGAFYQYYQNFYFYWIMKAGHMVPADAGEMALMMMNIITKTT